MTSKSNNIHTHVQSDNVSLGQTAHPKALPDKLINVAIVGHTNTGKTSLLRTLLRDVYFGEVCNRPSTTRHVEASELIINKQPMMKLFDTPGLEDSIGLLATINTLSGVHEDDDTDLGIDKITRFLDSDYAHNEYAQEAKVLRQLLASDVALYVIDAREPVLSKYQDELKLLSYCAKPIMPVLNFIANDDNNKIAWQEHLAKLNLHAVIDFDTVAYSKDNENSLFNGMQTLLPLHRDKIKRVLAAREKEWQNLQFSAALLLAELLVDIAAYREKVDINAAFSPVHEQMQVRIRNHENHCIDQLLDIFKFYTDEFNHDVLPVQNGRWQQDIFDPDTFLDVGLSTSKAMAKGAAVGVTIDIFTGGLTLGIGAALGAATGALLKHGRSLVDAARGYETFRIDDTTLTLIALREIQLIIALSNRGHATQKLISLPELLPTLWGSDSPPPALKTARRRDEWSHLNSAFKNTKQRQETLDELAEYLRNTWRNTWHKT